MMNKHRHTYIHLILNIIRSINARSVREHVVTTR